MRVSSGDHVLQAEVISGSDWLSASELAALTPDVVKRRLLEIQPLIRENARKAEEQRRPVTEVISAIRKTGLFYLMVPRAYGGMGATPNDLLDLTLPIAEACMSTAWVCNFVVNHSWLFSHFPEEAQRETWGGRYPYMFITTVSNPIGRAQQVDGGYRISGRWKWASGIMHADWVIGFVNLGSDTEPALGLALFPVTDAKILDTWHTDGLCGSGSHDVVVEDLFIPAHRTVLTAPILEGTSGAAERFGSSIYGMPMVPFLGFAAAGSAIGGARAAIAAIAKRLAVHTRVGDTVVQVEKPISQARLARADLLARTGEMLIRQIGVEMIQYQGLPAKERLLARVRWRAQTAQAVHTCREAIQIASASAGSSMHFLDNPLQRIMRDINIQSTHYGFDQDSADEQYGRVLAGLMPNSPLY
jgi:3-hydroxy-9,10-secoandrosta-1,3,5(10)-triene-9,17-dione monooxygenase